MYKSARNQYGNEGNPPLTFELINMIIEDCKGVEMTNSIKRFLEKNRNKDKHFLNILISGRPPWIPSNTQMTPIMLAAKHAKYDIVKLLVEYGSDLTIRNQIDETVLDISITKHVFATCSISTKRALALMLIVNEMHKSSRIDLKFCGEYGSKVLIDAIRANDLLAMKVLIECGGVDVNLRFGSEYPLIVASFYGKLKVVELLIDANADLNVRDELGRSAIMRESLNTEIAGSGPTSCH